MENCKNSRDLSRDGLDQSLHNRSNVYYGVHIPSDIQIQENDDYINVFQDKTEALKVVKKYKKARFKAFTYYHEAESFAVHGCECPNNNTTAVNGKTPEPSGSPVGEKPSQFRGPKSQDLVRLRKAIEVGDVQFVYSTIWENPRYLVSAGDTPSILQEGFRYNALHVAAKSRNARMCELILHTVSNPAFVRLLYGDDINQNADERTKILLDLYLNTPDKGLNETPLHFAVKFGAVECVEVLTSYPQCDRNCRNKYGKTPSMIVCDRCDSSVTKECKRRIVTMLEENYYVPVLRAEDNCSEPVIGEPFSPSSPPNLNSNILKPRLEIHAYAGPMEKTEADEFRRLWKKPPRSLISTPPVKGVDLVATMRLKDVDKGLERLGKTLANKYHVEWKEYWPFLDSFVDLSSDEGLELLEKYLAYRTSMEYSGSIPSPPEVSSDGRNGLHNLSDLCRAFQAFNLSDKETTPQFNFSFEERVADSSSQVPSPFLYVDKSCQVFANRISQPVLNLLETEYNNILQMLESEMKHLEHLMVSYVDDTRFSSVNFNVVHSRLGTMVGNRLKDLLHLEDDYISLRKKIEILLEKCNKHLDYFSSDDESMNHRNQVVVKKKSTSTNRQVTCLLECILDNFGTSDAALADLNTEAECSIVWKEAKPCACIWQVRGSKKGSSLSRNNSLRHSARRFKNQDVTRRLVFDDESCPENSFKSFGTPEQVSDGSNKEGSSSSDDEEYFTPPSSPSLMEISDDEFYFDSILPDKEIFIEGDRPTKTDCAVFDALRFGGCELNPDKFPNIFRWYHSVSLYSPEERLSWPNSCVSKWKLEPSAVTSTPIQNKCQQKFSSSMYTPPRTWLRVTGANSPKASLRSQNNLSANL